MIIEAIAGKNLVKTALRQKVATLKTVMNGTSINLLVVKIKK